MCVWWLRSIIGNTTSRFFGGGGGSWQIHNLQGLGQPWFGGAMWDLGCHSWWIETFWPPSVTQSAHSEGLRNGSLGANGATVKNCAAIDSSQNLIRKPEPFSVGKINLELKGACSFTALPPAAEQKESHMRLIHPTFLQHNPCLYYYVTISFTESSWRSPFDQLYWVKMAHFLVKNCAAMNRPRRDNFKTASLCARKSKAPKPGLAQAPPCPNYIQNARTLTRGGAVKH